MENNPEPKKKCKNCGKEKPLKEFKKSQHMKDGYENKCLACYKVYKEKLKAEKEEYADAYFNFK